MHSLGVNVHLSQALIILCCVSAARWTGLNKTIISSEHACQTVSHGCSDRCLSMDLGIGIRGHGQVDCIAIREMKRYTEGLHLHTRNTHVFRTMKDSEAVWSGDRPLPHQGNSGSRVIKMAVGWFVWVPLWCEGAYRGPA